MKVFDYLKNILIVLVILQIAPILFENIRAQYSTYIFPRTRFALIEVKGVLYNSEKYNKYLKQYFEDDSIKGIMLKMECPGSASGTAHALFNEITKLKKQYPAKPIITLVENICASGGYYMACATDGIICPASSLIGSIGANLPYLFQLQNFIEQHNVKYESIKAGKYKSVADPFVTITPEEKAMLQSVIDDTYNQFIQDVVTTRKLSTTDTSKWADGKLFSGRQAQKLGLIDIIGSSSDAIALLREKALVDKDQKIEWIKPAQKMSLWSFFSGNMTEEEGNSMFSCLLAKLLGRFQSKQIQGCMF